MVVAVCIGVAALAVVQTLLFGAGVWPPFDGRFVGPDTYMRLSRVLECRGSCPGGLYVRSDAPFGEVLHWPFLLDRIILALSLPFQGLWGPQGAITLAGYLLGPLLSVGAAMALALAALQLIPGRGAYLAALLFPIQLWVPLSFAPHRPDHHRLQVLLFLAALAGGIAVLERPDRRDVRLMTGFFAGMALWVSAESLISLAPLFGILSLAWLVRGGAEWARASRDVCVIAAAVLAVGLLVDGPGPDRLAAEFDRFSIVHLTLFGLVGVFWILASRFSPSRRNRRGAFAGAGLLAVAALMALAFPGFYRGPMVSVHPDLFPLWMDSTAEFMPVIGGQNRFWTGQAVLPMVGALPVTVWLAARGPLERRWAWAFLAVATAWFGGLMLFQQVRWVQYLHALAALPLGWLLAAILRSGRHRVSGLRRLPLDVAAVLAFLAAPLIVMVLLVEPKGSGGSSTRACDATPLIGTLVEVAASSGEEDVILAPLFWGPEVLWWTPLRVIATPFHRNASGILESYRVMTARSAEEAHGILMARDVRWIAACRGEAWSPLVAPDEPGTFYRALQDGSLPEWLRPVPLREPVAKTYLLWELQQDTTRVPYPL